MDNDIIELIDKYKALLDEKERLADMTKANNKDIETYRNALAQAMLDAEVPEIGRDGYMYRLKPTTKYSKKGGMDEVLFDLLRSNGLGDIIKETVNAQTLQGAMSELASENNDQLPEEFAECINVYEFTDVSRRKTTSKINH